MLHCSGGILTLGPWVKNWYMLTAKIHNAGIRSTSEIQLKRNRNMARHQPRGSRGPGGGPKYVRMCTASLWKSSICRRHP